MSIDKASYMGAGAVITALLLTLVMLSVIAGNHSTENRISIECKTFGRAIVLGGYIECGETK